MKKGAELQLLNFLYGYKLKQPDKIGVCSDLCFPPHHRLRRSLPSRGSLDFTHILSLLLEEKVPRYEADEV